MSTPLSIEQLVELQEKNQKLLELHRRRERLRTQLQETDHAIRSYLQSHPTARRLLAAVRAVPAEENHTGVRRRPRGALREQIVSTLQAARKPLTPARIRDVIAAKNGRTPNKNLYISILQQLRRGPIFCKTADGWVMAISGSTTI